MYARREMTQKINLIGKEKLKELMICAIKLKCHFGGKYQDSHMSTFEQFNGQIIMITKDIFAPNKNVSKYECFKLFDIAKTSLS